MTSKYIALQSRAFFGFGALLLLALSAASPAPAPAEEPAAASALPEIPITSVPNPDDSPPLEMLMLDRKPVVNDSFPRSHMKPKGQAGSAGPKGCKRYPKTLREALGPEVEKIEIQGFSAESWGDVEAVTVYLRRILAAAPESGWLSPFPGWSEMAYSSITARIEFTNGKEAPLHVGNGYLRAVDAGGCDWWARYLGWDREKWVVRPDTPR